ncbi:hypothetical protein DACRYDRAFT_105076 [Dacryopinax primogenitus]|uniref:DBF4-type domain-containing protein n=1 Tax=Dacryopinax primogenitus (strain DJM 731) TaxID=1858805 RepID=M5G720_DACPD|nr:uncharacterized protein DACRYDRAFT_105076 [Dacryopinax primogenitus]EJU04005.1 hypothetical protein DACRYDRAFT_105076 [Dacryopinax primogenitus]
MGIRASLIPSSALVSASPPPRRSFPLLSSLPSTTSPSTTGRMAAVAVTPRPQHPFPRPVWTHDPQPSASLQPTAHMMTPSHLPRALDNPMDVFTASAPARMANRAKRTRDDTRSDAAQPPAPKRTCASPSKRLAKQSSKTEKDKLERREKRMKYEAQEREFREKYSAAFPKWTFHFDSLDTATASMLTQRVTQLGARVDTFFSKKVSHVISTRPVLPDAKAAKGTAGREGTPQAVAKREVDKENVAPRSSQPGQRLSQAQSTQQWKNAARPALAPLGRRDGNLLFEDSMPVKNDLLSKAIHFGMKVWSVEKLTSVLDRIQLPVSPVAHTPNLSHLLADERLHGTRERDPNALRPDYTYFQRGSYFVLIEDMSGEHCPIMIKQYDRPAKGERAPWPCLYADKNASGPFSPGYEESTSEEKPLARLSPEISAVPPPVATSLLPPAQIQKSKKSADLRRVLSMNNVKRLAGQHAIPDASIAVQASHDRPGAYMAASGNSVSVTSAVATSTRSASGTTLPGGLGHAAANKQLQDRLRQQVLTNRLAAATNGAPALRKSKSTNTLKLPMREETKKPGYCENCRIKFADFSQHVKSKKHRTFATTDDNFVQLDEVLERLIRPKADEKLDIVELPAQEEEYEQDSNVLDEEADVSGDLGLDDGEEGTEEHDESMLGWSATATAVPSQAAEFI